MVVSNNFAWFCAACVFLIQSSAKSLEVYAAPKAGRGHGKSLISDARAINFARQVVDAIETVRKYPGERYESVAFVEMLPRSVFPVDDKGVPESQKSAKVWNLESKADCVFAQIAKSLLSAMDQDLNDEFDPKNMELVMITETQAISVGDFLMLKNAIVDMFVLPLVDYIRVYEREIDRRDVLHFVFAGELDFKHVSSMVMMLSLSATLLDTSSNRVAVELRERLVKEITELGLSGSISNSQRDESGLTRLSPVQSPLQTDWALRTIVQGKYSVSLEEIVFGVLMGKLSNRTNMRFGAPTKGKNGMADTNASIQYYSVSVAYIAKWLKQDGVHKEAATALSEAYNAWYRVLKSVNESLNPVYHFDRLESRESYATGISVVRSTNNARATKLIGGRYLEPYAAVSSPYSHFIAKLLACLYNEAAASWKKKLTVLGGASHGKLSVAIGHGALVSYHGGYYYVMDLADADKLFTEHDNLSSWERVYVYRLHPKSAMPADGFSGLREFAVFEYYSVSVAVAEKVLRGLSPASLISDFKNNRLHN